MIKVRLSYLAFTLSLLIPLFSCNKDEDNENLPVYAVGTTDVTETGFTIHWLTASPEYTSLKIEVSESSSFDDSIKEYVITDPGITFQEVKDLYGATKYYFRITITELGMLVYTTAAFSERTKYTSEKVSISTPDGLTLSGKLSYLSYLTEPRPGIIFMHELGVWVNNWKAADVVKDLIADGYICLVFDFRGHGNSTSIDDLSVLIEDWSLVAADLSSAVSFIKKQDRVNGEQLALVGGSLGGIMAIAGNGYEQVQASVALSAAKMGVYQLFPDMTISNALYIVGEKDIRENPNVNFPAESEYLYNHTEEPRKLKVIPGTSNHGTELLEMSGVSESIREWINSSFQDK